MAPQSCREGTAVIAGGLKSRTCNEKIFHDLGMKGQHCRSLHPSLCTHTHAYTHSSERSKISPTCELMTCCFCTLSHLMRSPSFFFSSASLCRTFISFSYSSSVRKLKSNMFSAMFFSSSDRWSNDTPATNPDQLAAMPWAAPSVLSEIRLEQKGFIHNSIA